MKLLPRDANFYKIYIAFDYSQLVYTITLRALCTRYNPYIKKIYKY